MVVRSENLTDAQAVRKYFNETVPALESEYCNYRWGRSPLVREHYFQTLEILERTLAQTQWDVLAEIGCGPCIWTPLLFQHAHRGIAVDLSIEMLKQSPKQASVARCCCGDATQLPLKSSSIDALCSIRAFEYFPDKTQAVKEFFRILRPNGFLMVVTKNYDYAGYGKNGTDHRKHIHRGNITSDEMRKILKSVGFVNICTRPVIVGRTRIIMIWKIIRLFRRFVNSFNSRALSKWLSGATESFMITAEKSV